MVICENSRTFANFLAIYASHKKHRNYRPR
jgi:hypothetical protein